jgi:hypothetical protein
MRRIRKTRAVALGAALATVGFGWAAEGADFTATWDGGAGNWNNASLWDIDLVPNNGGVNEFFVIVDGKGGPNPPSPSTEFLPSIR